MLTPIGTTIDCLLTDEVAAQYLDFVIVPVGLGAAVRGGGDSLCEHLEATTTIFPFLKVWRNLPVPSERRQGISTLAFTLAKARHLWPLWFRMNA